MDKNKYKIKKQNQTFPIIETRKCLMCGSKYGINSHQKNKLYCDGCRKKHRLEYQREYEKRNVEKNRVYSKKWRIDHYKSKTHFNMCALCGGEFLAKQGNAKYCIPCLEKEAPTNWYYRTILERRAI